jgi:hypothetical protein
MKRDTVPGVAKEFYIIYIKLEWNPRGARFALLGAPRVRVVGVTTGGKSSAQAQDAQEYVRHVCAIVPEAGADPAARRRAPLIVNVARNISRRL